MRYNKWPRELLKLLGTKQKFELKRTLHLSANVSRFSVRSISTCCKKLKLHHNQPKAVSSPQHAELFVASLRKSDRVILEEALKKYNSENEGQQVVSPPTIKQLKLAAYHTAIPFMGFGFLDNAIMIIAGEYIELKIGVTLGISTMAAAALGNIVSDVSGLGLAGYVEALATRLGFEGPQMNSAQLQMTRTVVATNLGRGIGIVIGCILGMFPLLFYKEPEVDRTETPASDTDKT
ncbi:transmembrane protein 65-like [Dendronephthya gigantea]|uniref:transmembrane protein 65-like n=1 Tax=Dendronephthya gigantea TaxID=151771 RepID=UPI00106B53AA|nr:transmembrane protein 65-like [Dendronephthya gigantea]